MHAYCFRSGHIGFGGHMPEGALPLLRGAPEEVREKVCARARHAYDGETLLVPGIPEAEDDEAAYQAFKAFREWLAK